MRRLLGVLVIIVAVVALLIVAQPALFRSPAPSLTGPVPSKLTPALSATVLPPGDSAVFICDHGGASGSFSPSQVTVVCATDTPILSPVIPPTTVPTSTATLVPTDTPVPPTLTATPVPTDTPVPPTVTATATATLTATSTSVPLTATPTHFAGSLGWLVSPQTTAQWNSTMRATDHTVIPFPLTQLFAQVKVSVAATGLQPTGTAPNITDPVNATNLALIDTAFQAAYGPVACVIYYADDNYNDSVANKIARMQTDVAFIRSYARANSAPAFAVYYVPAGTFIDTNLAAHPEIRTFPDGNVFQAQSWEDTGVVNDPTFQAAVTRNVNALMALDPSKPLGVQLQTYSKKDPTVVWPASKLIAEIDWVGTFRLIWVTVYYADPQNPAGATVLTDIMAAFGRVAH